MAEIKLTKAVRIPPAQALRASGRTANVDEAFAAELVAQGKAVYLDAAVEEDTPEVEEAEAAALVDDADTAEAVEEDTPEVEEAEAAPATTRPKKSASLAVWREYAASKGLKTTGLKLQEIIGAIESQNL